MLPPEFLTRMQHLLGSEYEPFLAAYDRPLQKGLRLGRKASRAAAPLPFLGDPIPWAPGGYRFDPDLRPGKHPYHEAGVYYLQEPSAMAPAALLVSNEVSPKRAKILSRNIERMGIANALVLNMHPRDLETPFAGFFDKIMVDAPCSGEGMFRKEEAAVTDWSFETVSMCAARQREILSSAAKMLRPGGTLCYSTCTFAPEEDEGVMAWFLAQHPDFSPADISAPWFSPARPDWTGPGSPELAKGFRLWPHRLNGEGHFVILLQKAGDAPIPAVLAPSGIQMPPELEDFLSELNIQLPAGTLMTFGQSLYLLPPDCPDLRGLKVLRPGLELGTLRKNRFEPAHALALWLSTAARTADFPADSREISDYLHGQVLPGPQTGWTLITVDGASLGWAKGSGGQLKNHFPKGLRWL